MEDAEWLQFLTDIETPPDERRHDLEPQAISEKAWLSAIPANSEELEAFLLVLETQVLSRVAPPSRSRLVQVVVAGSPLQIPIKYSSKYYYFLNA